MSDYAAAAPRLSATSRDGAVSQSALGSTVAVFTATTFLSSTLLFLVQPMFAKLMLPLLGGSPSVWNTCVLFFQASLLLGYLYAHLSTSWFGFRRQLAAHLLLLVVPLAVLPLSAGIEQPPPAANPVWWLLRTATLTVGLPFFVVSTSAPLLQKWFATLPLLSARDPYFLYAASNLGSMVALLGYPILLEPLIGTRHQTWLWSGGYLILVAMVTACAVLVWVRGGTAAAPESVVENDPTARPGTHTRLSWLILAFVPSSLMLGVTTHISTDIAAVPMLWVGPLALYLATFVLAFSTRALIPHRLVVRVLPMLILASLITILLNLRAGSLITIHILTFFATAYVCHRALADERPGTQHLTEFYLWMSLGGTLGGVFNGLVAPRVFSGILEYPLVLVLAAAVRPSPAYRRSRPDPWGLLIGLPAMVLVFLVGIWAVRAFPQPLGLRPLLLAFATVLAFAYASSNRTGPVAAMSALFVLVIVFGRPPSAGTVLLAARSFFGVYRVVDAPDHSYHVLQHGSTTHGREQAAPATACQPTGYYHPSSPIGQLVTVRRDHLNDVALVGLGTGALACYAVAGERWTFYEIDPVVETIARDPRYFRYLQNSAGRNHVVLGDARLSLQHERPGQFDLIVLDAFSSDAIPTHLLTNEALALYLSRLQPDGIAAFHISNRYLNLEPLLGSLAERNGLIALANTDDRPSDADAAVGKFASHWVLMARDGEAFSRLDGNGGWRKPRRLSAGRVWTDDYSNILQTLVR